jgi:hypothetical protein
MMRMDSDAGWLSATSSDMNLTLVFAIVSDGAERASLAAEMEANPAHRGSS